MFSIFIYFFALLAKLFLRTLFLLQLILFLLLLKQCKQKCLLQATWNFMFQTQRI